MKVGKHYILMAVTLVVACICGVLMPRVKVNSDMTKYLPDASPMRYGLSILSKEFDAVQMAQPDVHAMFPGLRAEERDTIKSLLMEYADVRAATYSVSRDSLYTLYDLVVPKSVDQKALGQVIRQDFGHEVVVETSQDGATPPVSALIIAGGLILAILLIMTQSWLDPLLILLVAMVAVIINIGTNAFLPSVSITTNYIVAILQLVLSLDYSIVLMNRYRQELGEDIPRVLSLNRAMKRSIRPIMSSALTTVVGLLMLAFMRLKIGLDMGVVLAKGVVCSLVCTFTFLPSLLLMCHKGLQKAAKPTPVLPTNRLSWFVTHHKVSLAIFAVVLFGVAFFFSKKTDIYFSTNGESRIAEIFPKMNTSVLVYDTQDEGNVFALADSLKQEKSVKAIISYPTLFKESYSAAGMVDYIHQLGHDMAEYIPAELLENELLCEEMLRVVYFLNTSAADTLRISFPSLVRFVQTECLNNPLFAGYIDDNIRSKIELLDVLQMEPEKEEVVIDVPVVTAEPVVVENVPAMPSPEDDPVVASMPENMEEDGRVSVIGFFTQLEQTYHDATTQSWLLLTDTASFNNPLYVNDMAAWIGSTTAQTKMVYSLAKTKQMTPWEYVHFLNDDLFHRKSLGSMVSEEQKQGLRVREQIMSSALADERVLESTLADWLRQLGWNMTEQQVHTFLYPEVQDDILIAQTDTVAATEPAITAVPSLPTLPPVSQPTRAKSREERQAELAYELWHSNKNYDVKGMSRVFARLGQSIDEQTLTMLYAYYGSKNCYDEATQMNLEQLLGYVGDTIPAVKEQVDEFARMLTNDRHSMMIIVTNLPAESSETYSFIDQLHQWKDKLLEHDSYVVGESAMFSEMKNGFGREMLIITLLTIIAIFLIVAISFRSLVVPTILVMTVMTAVYVNVIFAGIFSGGMLYLAYLIAQSILMGATIDYGILFANYYKEHRRTLGQYEAAQEAYHGSIRTIMTSGLIMVLGPGVMAVMVEDVAISAIVGCISVGAFAAVLLILTVLPGILVAYDRWVV